MLAATAAGGVVTAATMTTANATPEVAPVKSDIAFGNPMSWASFNNAPRRIQNGGGARQVTQDSFAVADTISGVNMRLTSGGIREMHWHQFAEWAYLTYGTCRITTHPI